LVGEIMKYGRYILSILKCKLKIGLGVLILLIGIVLFMFNILIGVMIILIGTGMILYGRFKLNEFFFGREEGKQQYHHRGRFR